MFALLPGSPGMVSGDMPELDNALIQFFPISFCGILIYFLWHQLTSTVKTLQRENISASRKIYNWNGLLITFPLLLWFVFGLVIYLASLIKG